MNWQELFPSLDMQLSDWQMFLWMIWLINLALLIFNLLPIFPLDGGQILRSLLWFVFGRAHSLMIAVVIGFCGFLGLLVYLGWDAVQTGELSRGTVWLIVLVLLIVLPNCWRGFLQAREMMRLSKAPRHAGFACPSCHAAPLAGAFWVCGHCRTTFDTFATRGVCPNCGAQFSATACSDCGQAHPLAEWAVPAVGVPPRL